MTIADELFDELDDFIEARDNKEATWQEYWESPDRDTDNENLALYEDYSNASDLLIYAGQALSEFIIDHCDEIKDWILSEKLSKC